MTTYSMPRRSRHERSLDGLADRGVGRGRRGRPARNGRRRLERPRGAALDGDRQLVRRLGHGRLRARLPAPARPAALRPRRGGDAGGRGRDLLRGGLVVAGERPQHHDLRRRRDLAGPRRPRRGTARVRGWPRRARRQPAAQRPRVRRRRRDPARRRAPRRPALGLPGPGPPGRGAADRGGTRPPALPATPVRGRARGRAVPTRWRWSWRTSSGSSGSASELRGARAGARTRRSAPGHATTACAGSRRRGSSPSTRWRRCGRRPRCSTTPGDGGEHLALLLGQREVRRGRRGGRHEL